MILSLIALVHSLIVPNVTAPMPTPIEVAHPSPRKIYMGNRARTIRIPRQLPARKSSEKPWDGYFSAQNFRENENPNTLNTIKADLRSSIVALPQWHTAALKRLEVKNDAHISRGLANSQKIILHTPSIENSSELMAVFIHEMGHITDLGALKGTRGQRTKFYDRNTPILSDDASLKFYRISWNNSHQKKIRAVRNDFVSGYAMTNVFEDFAETYTFYRLHGEKFREISQKSSALRQKYQFMKRYVFNNKEFQLNKKNNDTTFIHNAIFDTTLLEFDHTNI